MEKETKKITGKVEAVSQKEKGYGLKIGDHWFNGFGTSPTNKGDEVEIEFVMNGNFNNIQTIKVVSEAPIEEKKDFKEENRQKQASVMISYAKDLAVAEMNLIGTIDLPAMKQEVTRIREELHDTARGFMELQKELVKGG